MTDNIAKKILKSKGVKESKTIYVPINSLRLARWDIRREDQEDEELESLKNSIEEHGLFHPLTVAKTRNTDKLTIMAGKRRFNAMKSLGWTQIPVNVLLEDATETDIRIIKVNENLQQKELEDAEKAFGILATYEAAGYTDPQEVIKGVKSLDNWFSNNTDHKTDWNAFERIHNSDVYSRQAGGRQTNPILYDKKFTGLCKSIAKTPKWQYQLLQIVVQIDPDVLIEAQKIGLSTKKKSLLTHTKLRDHPKIQKMLIREIAPLNDENAAHAVRQQISDLETGYTTKIGDQYVYGEVDREVIPKDAEGSEVEHIPLPFTIVGATFKIIQLLTGRILTKGEYKYTKEIIDKNKELMYKIAKFCTNERQLISIVESLEVTKYTIEEMIKIVDSELEVIKNKKELSTK